jgi:hypothetical protein
MDVFTGAKPLYSYFCRPGFGEKTVGRSFLHFNGDKLVFRYDTLNGIAPQKT